MPAASSQFLKEKKCLALQDSKISISRVSTRQITPFFSCFESLFYDLFFLGKSRMRWIHFFLVLRLWQMENNWFFWYEEWFYLSCLSMPASCGIMWSEKLGCSVALPVAWTLPLAIALFLSTHACFDQIKAISTPCTCSKRKSALFPRLKIENQDCFWSFASYAVRATWQERSIRPSLNVHYSSLIFSSRKRHQQCLFIEAWQSWEWSWIL